MPAVAPSSRSAANSSGATRASSEASGAWRSGSDSSAIDVTEVYGRHTGRGPRIPQVGLAVSPDYLAAQPEVVAAVHQACVAAGPWVLAHPDAAGALVAPSLGLPAQVIARSLPRHRASRR